MILIIKNDGENVNIRIDCNFRAHMEYKRPDVGLKIYREALARFTEFSNLRLGVYTPYAHESSNQSLIVIVYAQSQPSKNLH